MFGGTLASRFARGSEEERADLARRLGRSSTAPRRAWRAALAKGRRDGWYTTMQGEISGLEWAPGEGREDLLRATVATTGQYSADWGIDVTGRVDADWGIDATGLQSGGDVSSVVADLLACDAASLSPLGGLGVDEAFRVRGAESGDGRLYVSGALAAGGPIAPVDSFWGLQRAALDISTHLAADGWSPRLTPRRSVAGWWRWARNHAP